MLRTYFEVVPSEGHVPVICSDISLPWWRFYLPDVVTTLAALDLDRPLLVSHATWRVSASNLGLEGGS